MILRVLTQADLDATPEAQTLCARHGIALENVQGMAWAGDVDGHLAAIGGVVPVSPGVGEIWLTLTDHGKEHAFRVCRTIRWLVSILIRYDYRRLQSRFTMQDQIIARWAMFMVRQCKFRPVDGAMFVLDRED